MRAPLPQQKKKDATSSTSRGRSPAAHSPQDEISYYKEHDNAEYKRQREQSETHRQESRERHSTAAARLEVVTEEGRFAAEQAQARAQELEDNLEQIRLLRLDLESKVRLAAVTAQHNATLNAEMLQAQAGIGSAPPTLTLPPEPSVSNAGPSSVTPTVYNIHGPDDPEDVPMLSL